jgi:opacity protein-like surface antigen
MLFVACGIGSHSTVQAEGWSAYGLLGLQAHDLSNQFAAQGVSRGNELLIAYGGEYRFRNQWALGGSYWGANGKVDIDDGAAQASMDVMHLAANVVYYPAWSLSIQPFVTGGIGVATLDIDRGDVGYSETNLAFNLGGGVAIPLSERLALRSEARYFFYDVGELSDTTIEALNLTTAEIDGRVGDFGVATGVAFSF